MLRRRYDSYDDHCETGDYDDYDNDGLANGNDECPESSSELCGYNYTNYIIGLKKTTNELFGITNSAYNFFQPHIDHNLNQYHLHL